jgi:hypothetical protein
MEQRLYQELHFFVIFSGLWGLTGEKISEFSFRIEDSGRIYGGGG